MKATNITGQGGLPGQPHRRTLRAVVMGGMLALGMFGAARAEPVTLPLQETVQTNGWSLQLSEGSSVFSYSASFIAALNANGVSVSPILPATLEADRAVNGKYNTVVVTTPVDTIRGDLSGNELGVTQVNTQGGLLYTAEPDGWEFTSLTITDLQMDWTTKRIYADVQAEGVAVNDVHLWDIGTITGSTTFQLQDGVNVIVADLSGLTMNAAALDLLATGLGATEAGRSALAAVTDFGAIRVTMSLGPTPVPEPAVGGLMLGGLAMVWTFSRRRARPQ